MNQEMQSSTDHYTTTFRENLKGRDHLGDLSTGWEDNTQTDLWDIMGGVRTGFN
jgi:hypothetical protein